MYLAYKAIKKRRATARDEVAADVAAAPNEAPANAAVELPASGPEITPTTDSPQTEKGAAAITQPAAGPSRKRKVKPCRHQLQGQKHALAQGVTAPELQDSDRLDGKKCLVCKQEKHDARVYRWKLILALLLPFFLASLDLTVVATALSFISSHFNKYNQLNWIVTAYTLTSTAFIPIFGQLADVFGRHSMLQVTMVLMAVGSVLCAAAQTWGMLLFGRALQGIGSAGIMNLIGIVLADKVSLKENSKNNTIFSFISGISYSLGPVIGGYLTNISWRYCFVISIPIAVAANVLIFVLLRKELVKGSYKRTGDSLRGHSFLQGLASVDFGGASIFILGVGLIILATAWGGSTYSWSSAAVLVPLVVGCALFLSFFRYEFLMEPGRVLARNFPRQTPMIPFYLFDRRDIHVLAVIQMATGAALYSIFYFVGIFFTLVEGYDAAQAGIQLIFYIPGIGIGVYSAMFLCNVWPCQTFWPLFIGTVIETIGFALLTWAVTTRNVALVNGMMALAGVGSGLRFMPISLHAVGTWPDKIAPALSIMRVTLPFGGTLGLTIMGAVFNNKLASAIANVVLPGGASINPHNRASLTAINALPKLQRHAVQDAGRKAVMWAFVSILPFLALSVVAACFLGNVWIKKRASKSSTAAHDEKADEVDHPKEGPQSQALHGVYLLALFMGRVEQGKVDSAIKSCDAAEDPKGDQPSAMA